MGIAFGILALGGTEPEIHPQIATYVLKNTIATLELNFNGDLRATWWFSAVVASFVVRTKLLNVDPG